jgi:DNA-3-methyladenine glycosylase
VPNLVENNLFLRKRPLPKTFFLQNTELVAKELLGKGLLIGSGRDFIVVEITEVEAYLGKDDPASHAYRGPTKRNWPMFEKGGMCYVYFSYGMHFCMNVVTGKKSVGEAVLLRGAVPQYGLTQIQKNRGFNGILTQKSFLNLTNGPGKLTQALGIDLSFNGRQFDEEGFKLINLGNK